MQLHRRQQLAAFGVAAMLAAFANTGYGQTPALTGQIVNANGAPVAGADLTLVNLPQAPMPNMPDMTKAPVPVATVSSGPNGSFTIPAGPQGNFVLQVDLQGFERWSQEVTLPAREPLRVLLVPLNLAGAEELAQNQSTDTQALLDRIASLEKKVSDLEATTVLSAPETRTRRRIKYIDKNSNIYDEPRPGTKPTTVYERERVLRRQNIDEKIEAVLANESQKSVAVGVSAGMVAQSVVQTKGEEQIFNGHKYALASADITFAARVAQNTTFFADIVGLTGPSADNEVGGITLLNSFNSRLILQNQLNIREAWLRTELFKQRLAITAGRVDLTNTFDRNALANDEFSQFVGDALVNNPALGLPVNGIGLVGVYDAKNSWLVKAGYQQSSLDITSLSDAAFNLVEVDRVLRPFGLNEGNYRVWYRYAGSTQARQVNRPAARGSSAGVSIDQRISNQLAFFGRYGYGKVDIGKLQFFSAGFHVQRRFVVNPSDYWSFGYAQTNVRQFGRENVLEGYYNFSLSEKLRLSLHLSRVEQARAGQPNIGYFVPGIRFIATF